MGAWFDISLWSAGVIKGELRLVFLNDVFLFISIAGQLCKNSYYRIQNPQGPIHLFLTGSYGLRLEVLIPIPAADFASGLLNEGAEPQLQQKIQKKQSFVVWTRNPEPQPVEIWMSEITL